MQDQIERLKVGNFYCILKISATLSACLHVLPVPNKIKFLWSTTKTWSSISINNAIKSSWSAHGQFAVRMLHNH